jgi:hypothetical protein
VVGGSSGGLVLGVAGAVDAAAEALVAPSLASHVLVPDFCGLSMTDVWARALKGNVKVKVARLPEDFPVVVGHEPPDEGRVARQGPAPGTKVRRGSEVELFVQFPAAGP